MTSVQVGSVLAEAAGLQAKEESARPASIVRVKTRGLSSMDRQLLIATIVGATIGYPLVGFVVIGGSPATLGLRLSIFTAALVCAALGASNIQAIRRVDVDDGGVTLRYLLRTVRVPWSDFAPPRPNPFAKEYGGTFLRRVARKPAGGVRRGHFVTRDQARAILMHPMCPKWDLDASLRTYLGLGG
jgi:Bacterial PH domain